MTYTNDQSNSSSESSLKDWNSHPSQGPDMQIMMSAAKWMWLLWPPVLIAMGTFGNVASLAVLSRMGLVGTSTINLYFFALAVSDLVVLHAGLLRYWLVELLSYDIYSWHTLVCKLCMWTYGTAWNTSTYLLVILTIQRAFSVVWPHRVHVMCTRRTTLALIGGTVVASVLFMTHVPYGYDVVYAGNSTRGTCGHGSADYFAFMKILVYIEIVTLALFPFVCLVISNSILAWRVTVSVSAAELNFKTKEKSEQVKERRKKASSTTMTVMVMSVAYILFTLPLFINILIDATQNVNAKGHANAQFSAVQFFVQSFVTILLFCNFAVNFYLYCLTGTKFRQEFLKLFRKSSRSTDGVRRMASLPSGAAEDLHDEF